MSSTGPIPLPGRGGPGRMRETAALLTSTVLRNVTQIVIVWLLATVTDPQSVGRYALVLAIATPVFVVAQLGIRGIYLTHAKSIALRSYLLVQLLFLAAAMIVTIGAAAAFDPSLILLAVLLGVAKASDALAESFSGVAQRFHRTGLILTSSAIVAVVGSAAVAIVLTATGSVELAILGFAVVNLVGTLAALGAPSSRLARADEVGRAMPAFSDSWRHVVAAGLPLGISTGLLQLVTSAPQYVLDQAGGSAEVGRLAVLIYAYAVADLVAGTLSIAWIQHAQEDLRTRPRGSMPITSITLRTIVRWTLIYVPITAVGVGLVWVGYPVVFGPDYAPSVAAVIALGVTVLLLPAANFATASTIVANRYAHSLAFSISAAIAGAGASILLVPMAGITGALWAMAIGNAVRAVVALVVTARGERRGSAADLAS